MAKFVLDPVWNDLGALDGPSWPPLAHIGPVLIHLWGPLAPLGRSLANPSALIASLGPPWTTSRPLLWRSLVPMAAPRCPKSPSWPPVGDPRVPFYLPCCPPNAQTWPPSAYFETDLGIRQTNFGSRNVFKSNRVDKKLSRGHVLDLMFRHACSSQSRPLTPWAFDRPTCGDALWRRIQSF